MPEGHTLDTKCKLVTEDERFVFFGSNWTSNKIASYPWTAEAEASQVWRNHRTSNSVDLARLANEWALDIEARYAHEHELNRDFLVGLAKCRCPMVC